MARRRRRGAHGARTHQSARHVPMTIGSRFKHAVLPAFCFKPSPTLDDDPGPSSHHRMPASPDLQPRGSQPDKSLRRRTLGWLRQRQRHHANQAEPPTPVPRPPPGTAPASKPAAKLELQRPPSDSDPWAASLLDAGPRFDDSRSSSLRVEVSQPDL